MQPPVGTVTFLSTDIEGSTKLWQEHPSAMAGALSRHHALLHESIAAHGGYVFQIIGDAFCASFSTANDGLEATLSAQRLLATENWGEVGAIRVRMALHTGRGEVKVGDYTSGEYSSGLTLSRTARMLSAGHGGQILLSLPRAELVRDQLAPGVSLRYMGECRLKDLERAEQIFQAVAPELQADFPPLKTLESFPNNLPLQLTSFIGREKEIAEVQRLLGVARLLTLTGPGGTGKTRLSLQAAANVLDHYYDGVWLVELAPITNPALIPQTVASVLGVREEQGMPLIQMISASLRTKSLLLILDNCEHLVEDVAKLVDTLLHACPHLHVLASSREILGIAGETSFRVPSLTVPALLAAGAGGLDLQSLSQYEAVRLFIERAQTVKPEFQMTNANAPAMVQVCQRLDGIPLAIELAAVRIKAMSLEQIAGRIDDRFRLLTGGSRTALPRHQTLLALIDWSYHLLSPVERILLSRLAVFVGGWTLEAAENVCSDPQSLPAEDVLDVLTYLVDKSLVITEEAGSRVRYRMLETIRQFARDRLLDMGEAERLQGRHLGYFLEFAQRMNAKLHGPQELTVLMQLEWELDNFRLALGWSQGEGRVETGLRLTGALWQFWDIQGYWHEGLEQTQSLLAHPQGAARNFERALGLLVAADLCADQQTCRTYLEELVPLAHEQGDAGKPLLALGVGCLSWIVFTDEPARAMSMLEEGVGLARTIDQPWITARLLRNKGWFFLGKRDFTSSLQAFEESQALSQSAGDRRMAALALRGGACVRFIQHDFISPIKQFNEVLQIFRELKALPLLGDTLSMLTTMERANGRSDLAKSYLQEADKIYRDLGDRNFVILFHYASIAIYEGDLNSARKYAAEMLELARECNSRTFLVYAIQIYGGIKAMEKKDAPGCSVIGLFSSLF